MDANRSSTVVLSSWDFFLLFRRVGSTRIHITRIIPRDRSLLDLRPPGENRLYASVEPDWSPLKLMFALLLAAAHPDKLAGFVQPNTAHLAVSSSRRSPTKRGRTSQSDEGWLNLPTPSSRAGPSWPPSRLADNTFSFSDALGDGFSVSPSIFPYATHGYLLKIDF